MVNQYLLYTGLEILILYINGTSYTAQADKVNIDGVEYYQLKLDKDLDNNFYKFRNNNFTNLIFKDIDTSNVTDMNNMFNYCRSLTSLDLSGWDTSNVIDMNSMFFGCNTLKTIRMVGCSQDTIDKIKSQLSTDSITGCTIVTE